MTIAGGTGASTEQNSRTVTVNVPFWATVNAASGDWNSVYSNVNTYSGDWTWGAQNSATILEDLTVHGSISARDGLSARNIVLYGDLSARGDISIDEYIYHNSDTDTYIRFTSQCRNTISSSCI